MNDDGGSDAVAIFATAIVLVLGAAFCSLIVLLVAEQATQALLISSAVIGGAIVLIWVLRGDSDSAIRDQERTWLRLFAKRKPKQAYKAKRVQKALPPQEEWGQNRPPSVESVREIKQVTDGIKNWTPRSTGESATDHPTRSTQG